MPFVISDLKEGELDANRLLVEEIYVRKNEAQPGDYSYAVYRTPRRVMIQFDDQKAQEATQRTMLAPLAPLRGQITAMIEDWSLGGDLRRQAQARCFQSRVAFALETGLENDPTNATKLLEEIRDDIIGMRTAIARFKHLTAAALVAAATFAAIWIASLVLEAGICAQAAPAVKLLNGLIGGATGAFFSIATALKSRTLPPDFDLRGNYADALLRMIIGTIAGGALVCLFLSGVVNLMVDGKAAASNSVLALLVFGFMAGFSERMVPDLLAKISLTAGTGKDAAAQTAQTATKTPLAPVASVTAPSSSSQVTQSEQKPSAT